MKRFSRIAYLLIAVALHAAALWGFSFGRPTMISDQEGPDDAVEVGLVETAQEAAPLASEPPAAEPTPEPPPPEPTPPPDAMPEPAAPLEKPHPIATSAPKLRPKPAPSRPATAHPSAAATVSKPGNPATTTATTGRPGPGDTAHASWRHRVEPNYPPSARAAKQAGRVLIVIEVGPTGRANSARISSSSGIPSLDQAALAAARASTYNPRKIAGLPLPDTITVPYTFRLDER